MALVELLGAEVVDNKGGKVGVETFAKKDTVVGLYFSAHWCPPCRGFTPMLAQYYKTVKGLGKNLEIVFLSSDRDETAFNEYFGEMPWHALAFDERERKDDLSKKFSIRGIPTLIMLNGEDAAVITGEGRAKVMEDTDGTKFPAHLK